MARRHTGLPRPANMVLSRSLLLEQLVQVDSDETRRSRVLRLETAFRNKISAHVTALPTRDASFSVFNTSPYVLMIYAYQRGYTKISEIETDILPSKLFSSMETSAGRMVEEVVLPQYGWELVGSQMHTPNSALDGKLLDAEGYHLVTLKSGPRCLNDEMSENFADAIITNYNIWARESENYRIEFTYGVLYGTKKMSNKKDWHILRNIKEKMNHNITINPDNQWTCQFIENGITVDITVRIGLDWWTHLGGDLCFVEVFTALIRACVNVGTADANDYSYTIRDMSEIVSTQFIGNDYNVSLLQRSQLPWLFLMAHHFCDVLQD